MARSSRHLFLAALALISFSGSARAGHLPEFDAAAASPVANATARPAQSKRAESALSSLARVQSRDERYDVPAFVWGVRRAAVTAAGKAARPAAARAADAAARSHLGELAPL